MIRNLGIFISLLLFLSEPFGCRRAYLEKSIFQTYSDFCRKVYHSFPFFREIFQKISKSVLFRLLNLVYIVKGAGNKYFMNPVST